MTDTGAEITIYRETPHRLRRDLWDMYTRAFEPMRTRAAQRHVMFHDEYIQMMDDTDVHKIVAYAGSVPVGLAAITNHLQAMPLIEPEYFWAKEPKLAEADNIWYMAFVCVRQTHPFPPRGVFGQLVEAGAAPIRAARGVCFMDYATVRVNQGLPRAANILLRGADPEATHEQVDAQTYWAYYPAGRPL